MRHDTETFFHQPDTLNTLTNKQMEIVLLVAEGWNNQAIGEKLYISKKTVEQHIHEIYSKMISKYDTKGRNLRCYLGVLARDWVNVDTPQD